MCGASYISDYRITLSIAGANSLKQLKDTVSFASWCFMLTIILLAAVSHQAMAQESSYSDIAWTEAPSTVSLGTQGRLRISGDYLFTGASGARRAMELCQNPTTGAELGLVVPRQGDWFVLFEFAPLGYVRDNERDSLDADAILEHIKQATAESNIERAQRGWPKLEVVGWEIKPRYNENTHNLEWAVRAISEGDLVVNYNTRLLGRDGVMTVTLVGSPEELREIYSEYAALLGGFSFVAGRTYEEYAPGDRVAEYGLTGLIVGGATAVAVKTGVFKWLWKAIVAVLAAGAAAIGKLFSQKKNV